MTARDNIPDEGQLLRADVELCFPSPTNPRKSFPAAELQELAESIKQLGVMQPILVRPLPAEIKERMAPAADRCELEIIAGERRWRASRLAGIPDVPILLRHLDDRTVICMQVVENLQRQDLNAIDEAEGFGQLQAQGMSAQDIATQVGKSKAYIYAKLKLLDLFPQLRAAVREKQIVEAVAVEIARIPVEAMQLDALRVVTARDEYTSEPMSYRAAKAHIRQAYTRNLAKAPFDPTDTMLKADAGSCTDCAHRIGNQPDSDPASANVCTNPTCFSVKRLEHNVRTLNAPVDTPRVEIPRTNPSYPTNYEDYDRAGYRILRNTNHYDPERRSYQQWLADNGETVPLAIHVCPHTENAVIVARVSDLAAAADRTASRLAETEKQQRLDVGIEQPARGEENHMPRLNGLNPDSPLPEHVQATADEKTRALGTKGIIDPPRKTAAAKEEHTHLTVAYTRYRQAVADEIVSNPPLMAVGPLLHIMARHVMKTDTRFESDGQAMACLLNTIASSLATAGHRYIYDDTLEDLATAVGVDPAAILDKIIPAPEGCARPNEFGVFEKQRTLRHSAGKCEVQIHRTRTAEGWRSEPEFKSPTGSWSGPISLHNTPYETEAAAVSAACSQARTRIERTHDIQEKNRTTLLWWLERMINEADGGEPGAIGMPGNAMPWRHPENPDLQWSGKGRKPQWVMDWIKDGGTIEQLRGAEAGVEDEPAKT